jgi:hypothetical protein
LLAGPGVRATALAGAVLTAGALAVAALDRPARARPGL